jgi:hypothetical protein
LGAVAFDTAVGFEHRLRVVPGPAAVLAYEVGPVRDANTDIAPWDVHSELVLVCPEVRKRALELLRERDPDAVLNRPRGPNVLAASTAAQAQNAGTVPVVVLGYALWRLGETARTALWAVGAVVALALLAEVWH